MNITRDGVTFSSGKYLSANCGIIGLSPTLEVSDGYDGEFTPYDEPLTREERKELSEFMVAQWTKYGEMEA